MDQHLFRNRIGLAGSSILIISVLLPASPAGFHVIENEAGILIAIAAIVSIIAIKTEKPLVIRVTGPLSLFAVLVSHISFSILISGLVSFLLFLGSFLLLAYDFMPDSWYSKFETGFQSLKDDGSDLIQNREQDDQSDNDIPQPILDEVLSRRLGISGAVVLLFGAFSPLVRAPMVGSISYIGQGTGDGLLIIALSVAAIYFSLNKKFKYVTYTGIASICLVAFTFLSFQFRFGSASNDMRRELADNPFRGIAEAAVQAVQLEWGWAVLLVGSGLLIACGQVHKWIK